MPAYVDLVGRACELSVTHVLCPMEETKRKLESILSRIRAKYPNNCRVHFKRIEVATEHAVKQIQSELGAKKVRRAEWTGESHKGIDNTDIVIQTEDGMTLRKSLKVYASRIFNQWNPTLNSCAQYFTGHPFEGLLSPEERGAYQQDMGALRDESVKSEKIGEKWCLKLKQILEGAYQQHPNDFVNKLLAKLGYGKNVLRILVSKTGKFQGLITGYPPILDRVAATPDKLTFGVIGVSVKIYFDQDEVTSFAVYAQSASQGRTGGLRIATWTPYPP